MNRFIRYIHETFTEMASTQEVIFELNLKKKMLEFKKDELENVFEMITILDADTSYGVIETHLELIKDAWNEFRVSLFELRIRQENVDETINYRKQLQRYVAASGRLRDLLKKSRKFQTPLPEIKLPEFSGKADEWHGFMQSFKYIIHNNETIDDGIKMHYLKMCLKGDAAKYAVIPSAENYKTIFDALCKCYDPDSTMESKSDDSNAENAIDVHQIAYMHLIQPYHGDEVIEPALNDESSEENYDIEDAPIISVLPTALVQIPSTNGEMKTFRSLLATGSYFNFITERALRELGLIKKPTTVKFVGIDGVPQIANGEIDLAIYSRLPGYPSIPVNFLVVNRVTKYKRPKLMNLERYEHLKDIRLADNQLIMDGTIDILFGVDSHADIIVDGVIGGPPMAQNTIFGWTVAGRVS